jgi:hypothetical protein
MYGYEPDASLNPFLLLAEYSQEEIFEIGLGEYPSLTKEYLSPFREDNKPNCYFEWSGDKLFFVDFGDPRRKGHRDCFNFIMDMFEICSYADLASYIVNHFSNGNVKREIRKSTKEEKAKERSQFVVKERRFERSDDRIWSQYEITREQLVADNVFGVLYYKLYSSKYQKWFTIKPYLETYVIKGFDDNRCKIYCPEERNKNRKWITNCTQNDVGGLETMDFTKDELIITKSYKDWRVVKNQGYNAVWFQNEGMFPNLKILNRLLVFPRIYILFDNDDTGIKAAQELYDLILSIKKEASVKQIFSPYAHLKDPAEIISYKGREELNKFLWKNCQV